MTALPGSWPSPRRLAHALALAAVIALALPAGALAHLRTGTIAVDYRASVLRPHTGAYDATIYQSDRGLSLTIKPRHAVALVGYLGELVFRLDPTGLWINASSPTAVVVGLLSKADLTRSGRGGAGGAPSWRLQRGRRSVSWHDSRVQEVSGSGLRGTWSVPLIVDGRPTHLRGTLERFGAPALVLWLAILACLIALAAPPVLSRRRLVLRDLAIAFGLVACTAAVVLAFAFAFDAYASPGTWIEAIDELAFFAAGLGVLLLGPRHLHAGAAAGLGFVSLAVGLLNGAVFLHPLVLGVLPGVITRVLCVTAIALGIDAVLLGCLFYADSSGTARGIEDEVGLLPALAGHWDTDMAQGPERWPRTGERSERGAPG